MTFTRVKPSGWATGEKLTSTQMNTLDTNVSLALDGRGGTYALTQPLVINGQSVTIGQTLTAANLVTGGSVTAMGALSGASLAVGSVAATGNINANGNLDIDGIGIFRLFSSQGPDADTQFDIGTRPGVVFIPNLTANRVYTLMNSVSLLGYWFLFINADGDNQVSIQSETTAVTFATVAAQGMVLVVRDSVNSHWNTFTFTGTVNRAP